MYLTRRFFCSLLPFFIFTKGNKGRGKGTSFILKEEKREKKLITLYGRGRVSVREKMREPVSDTFKICQEFLPMAARREDEGEKMKEKRKCCVILFLPPRARMGFSPCVRLFGLRGKFLHQQLQTLEVYAYAVAYNAHL